MSNLRQMIDGRTLDAASAAATHVAKHIEDPYAATKSDLDDLNKSLMDYNLKRQQMKMKLNPVENVVTGIKNMHQLDNPSQQIDPRTGLPMTNPDMGEDMGPPPNMAQSPGNINQNNPGQGFPPGTSPISQMNQQRPSMVGNQPGVTPGGFNEKQVVPAKMGVPQPGQGNASTRAGFPAGWNPPGTGPNPQNNQYDLPAKPPMGNRQLPGAKGPGDPKVTKQIKKSQNGGGGSKSSSGGRVNIHVHADANASPARMTQASFIGSNSLRSCNSDRMKSYGTSEGVSKAWDSRGRKGDRSKDPEFEKWAHSKVVPKAKENSNLHESEQLQQIKDEFKGCSHCEEENENMDAAVLTMKRRKKFKKSTFAIPEKAPGSGSYPLPDANHGRIAKALVKMHGTPKEKARVNHAVKQKFGFAN